MNRNATQFSTYSLVRLSMVVVGVLWGAAAPAWSDDAGYLYGVHWYGDAGSSIVEDMTGGRGIWSLETVMTNGDSWWGPEWQRDNRFQAMVSRGHSIIVRVERNWGETVPYAENLAQYLVDVQAAAQALAGVCHIWQIGNEMNIYGEWGGNMLTASAYVDMYRQIRAAIKAVPSPLGEQIVLLGPVSPGDVIGGVRHTAGNDYLAQMCALLAPAEVDGFALHAYAAPWRDAAWCRDEFEAGYATQLAILDTKGFIDKPVYITEWNRRVDPINDPNEAQSALFLAGAFEDLNAWNALPGAHPIGCACWFIYQYDSGTWANYSIEYLHGVGPSGPDADLWDSLQAACANEYPTASPSPGATSRMYDAIPSGVNVATQAVGVCVDSGSGGELAIDGIISSDSQWISDGSTPPHWLQLDLGQPRLLTGFVVHHAGAGGEPAFRNTEAFQFRTALTDPAAWEVDVLVYNEGLVNCSARSYNEPRLARYVCLYVTDTGFDTVARIPELEVYAIIPMGDYDGDGDVDGTDFAHFTFCMQGPDETYVTGHTCLAGDADEDLDLDLADLAIFQTGFTGSIN